VKSQKYTADKAVFWIAISGSFMLFNCLYTSDQSSFEYCQSHKRTDRKYQTNCCQKYSERVHFESHSEFGQLAKSFNTMAEKLEEYNNSSLAKLMMEKKRIETLINNMHDPVIGLDENLKIILQMKKLFEYWFRTNMKLLGKTAQELAVTNDLIRTLIQDLMIGENGNMPKQLPLKYYAENKESYFEKETIPHFCYTHRRAGFD
jgi:NtrC-family two-component system sensor histidine kinase KinB